MIGWNVKQPTNAVIFDEYSVADTFRDRLSEAQFMCLKKLFNLVLSIINLNLIGKWAIM